MKDRTWGFRDRQSRQRRRHIAAHGPPIISHSTERCAYWGAAAEKTALLALPTALPTCKAKLLLLVCWFAGPIVMMRSCVRVRPVLKNGADPVLADMRRSFQVGVTLPLDTMTNLTS